MKHLILAAALLIGLAPSPVPAQNEVPEKAQAKPSSEVQVVVTELPQELQEAGRQKAKEEIKDETQEAVAEDQLIRRIGN